MKIPLLMALLVLASVGVAAGYTAWEFGGLSPRSWQSYELQPEGAYVAQSVSPTPDRTTELEVEPEIAGNQPKAVLDATEFDFGQERNHTKDHRHTFTVRNEGTAPLRLLDYELSCTICTRLELPKEEIAPGASAPIVFHWDLDLVEEVFRKTATIFTNEKANSRLTLTVFGKVLQPLVVTPSQVVLSNVRAGERTEAKLQVFAYFQDNLELTHLELGDKDNAEWFGLTSAPIAKADLGPNARSGVEVTLTLKPGLPLGAFRQTILLGSNVPDIPAKQIKVRGMIVSDLSIIGRDWDTEGALLRLGAVTRSEGAKRTLTILVRGELQNDLKLSKPQVYPDLMQVRLSEPKRINNGAVTQITVTLEIPPDCAPVNHMGTEDGKVGEILIPTNQSSFESIRLRVQFAIEG